MLYWILKFHNKKTFFGILFFFLLLGCNTDKDPKQTTSANDFNSEDSYMLSFYTEEIAPGIDFIINSSHNLIWVEKGVVTHKQHQREKNMGFYSTKGDTIKISKSGAVLWRWEFVSKSSSSKGPSTFYNTSDHSSNGMNIYSSTIHKTHKINNLSSFVSDSEFVFRLEKLSLKKGRILNGINAVGANLGVLIDGNIKVIKQSKENEYTESKESWSIEYPEMINLSARENSLLFTASVVPTEYHTKPLPLPSLLNKIDSTLKGNQEIILDILLQKIPIR